MHINYSSCLGKRKHRYNCYFCKRKFWIKFQGQKNYFWEFRIDIFIILKENNRWIRKKDCIELPPRWIVLGAQKVPGQFYLVLLFLVGSCPSSVGFPDKQSNHAMAYIQLQKLKIITHVQQLMIHLASRYDLWLLTSCAVR